MVHMVDSPKYEYLFRCVLDIEMFRLCAWFFLPFTLTGQASDLFSGSWIEDVKLTAKANGINLDASIELRVSDDKLSFSSSVESCTYETSLDGKQTAVSNCFPDDSVSALRIGPRSVRLSFSRAGISTSTDECTLSEDLRRLFISRTGDDNRGRFRILMVYDRASPVEGDPLSGIWKQNIEETQPREEPPEEFKRSGKELHYVNNRGLSYRARADGRDYPVSGGLYTSVAINQTTPNTLIETFSVSGQSVRVQRRTVSTDGKEMRLVVERPSFSDTGERVIILKRMQAR